MEKEQQAVLYEVVVSRQKIDAGVFQIDVTLLVPNLS